MRRPLTALLATLAVLLCACKVDVTVDVEVEPDGSGSVTVTVVADAEVVAAAPGLADDLRLTDATAAGWAVDGPRRLDDGGLMLTLTHPFTSVAEATSLLESLNGTRGPLRAVELTRVVTDADVTTRLTGDARVDGGLDAFADPAVLAAIGATPYASAVAEAGLRPADAVSFVLIVRLPGTVTTAVTAAGGSVPPAADELTFEVPLDGTPVRLDATAVQARDVGGGVWSTVSLVTLVALVAWCVLAGSFVVFVVVARRRRARRRAARAAMTAPS